jgi:uncharacterized protein
MGIEHQPVVFECQGEQLLGVIERPEKPRNIGMLIVTGGPQYRIGSHRQFVLIACALARNGFATMRFDYRGMGDGGGPTTTFDQVSSDIRAAIDCFVAQASLDYVVLWGLCDAASACLIYGYRDERVKSMILLNPWIRTDAGLAKAYLRHYYLGRVTTAAFWQKLLSGHLPIVTAIRNFKKNLALAVTRSIGPERESSQSTRDSSDGDFRANMHIGFRKFDGPILIMLCGNDLTAAEFESFAKSSKEWRNLVHRSNVDTRTLEGMDHTFSRSDWRDEVTKHSQGWLEKLESR